jgi:hypothetical protein
MPKHRVEITDTAESDLREIFILRILHSTRLLSLKLFER